MLLFAIWFWCVPALLSIPMIVLLAYGEYIDDGEFNIDPNIT